MTETQAFNTSFIRIEVVYAKPGTVWRKMLEVPAGTTARQAFEQSGFVQAFPHAAQHICVMGVFGRRCHDNDMLADGDRLELYRPLQFDPKESRRRRAQHKQRVKNGNGTV